MFLAQPDQFIHETLGGGLKRPSLSYFTFCCGAGPREHEVLEGEKGVDAGTEGKEPHEQPRKDGKASDHGSARYPGRKRGSIGNGKRLGGRLTCAIAFAIHLPE